MSRITSVVIGGAGFIGSHLCRALLDAGQTVYCIDDLSSGSMPTDARLVFYNIDIVDRASLLAVTDTIGNAQYVYHLACPASPVKYQEDSLRTLNICFNGTQNVLEFARRLNAKLLFTSTSEVYGDPLVHPQTEEYCGNVKTIGPRACYDEGKRVAETLISEYCRFHSMNYIIVRLFNTYGPGMATDDGRVMLNFIQQAKAGVPLTVYGGQQTRSFCYVSDTVNALILLTNSTPTQTGPINIGNPCEIKIIDLAVMINDMLGNTGSGSIKLLDYRVDDPNRRLPDISKAVALGWRPTVDLRRGILNLL